MQNHFGDAVHTFIPDNSCSLNCHLSPSLSLIIYVQRHFGFYRCECWRKSPGLLPKRLANLIDWHSPLHRHNPSPKNATPTNAPNINHLRQYPFPHFPVPPTSE